MKSVWRWFRQGPLTTAALLAGHLLLLGLGRTWHIRHMGTPPVDALRASDGKVFYAIYHGVLLPLAFTHRGRAIQILVSQSRDGEIIARVVERLGFACVRGSSTRGGREALVEMCRRGRAGFDLGITPDGPRGPRGSVSPGAIVISQREGVPVVPIAVGADRAWRLKSWDRFLVPKPGAHVSVVYGAPHRIPERSDEESVGNECRRLERVMAETEDLANRYATGKSVPGETRREPA